MIPVLLVEDSPSDARLLEEFLEEVSATEFELTHVQRLAEAQDRLQEKRFEVVLLDLGLPDSQGLNGLEKINTLAPGTAIIVLTGLKDEEVALKALHEGAQDYLMKGQVDGLLLTRAIRYAIERKRVAEELRSFAARLEQSNKDLQDFAYIVSHDLKEPLRKIRMFGGQLETRCKEHLPAEAQDYLRRMQNAAQRMDALINGLLAFSRVTTRAQEFVSVPLCEVVQEVLSDLEARIRETRACIHVGNLPAVEADPLQMRQLFQNLIGNALKFMAAGQTPQICISSESHSPVAGRPRDFCRIAIEDNGIGFDEQYADHIFGVFQRLHTRNEYEGSGIGLSICRKIVERHGGTITAKSPPGQGSTFIVTLPLSQT